MSAMAELADIRARLVAIVGEANLLSGAAARPYATDVYRQLAEPLAVIRPGTVEELQAVVAAADDAGVALSVRGGGASYTDGYLPRDAGQLLIDMGRLDRIVSLDERDGYVTVEAGITWQALKDALDRRGLRTPFWGPFSGLASTVGGAASQHAVSHGSGAHGISAQSILALDVVLADGSLLRTGSGAIDAAPFARFFGPDLTGLFTGDGGTLGIKARVTLPLLRKLPAHRVISFAFADFAAMHEAMRRIALERIEDSHFALDAALSQGQIARQERAGPTLSLALGIVRSSPSLAAGLRQVAHAALSARKSLRAAAYMTHYIVEGLDDAEARARLHRLRELVRDIGQEIAAVVPAVVRDMPFAPLFNTLGPAGERWVPLHGILAHRDAPGFHDALTRFYAEHADEMKRHGVWAGGMFATIGSSGFLYEIALYWPDAISAYHEAAVPADYLAKLPRHAENPDARAYVDRLKRGLIDLFVAHGAINFQLGKSYPYASRLSPEPLALMQAVKAALDPDRRLSPGGLGL